MRILYKTIPENTIDKFADQYDLEMVIHERDREAGSPDRYYAHFHDAEVTDGAFLTRVFGNGATPEEAIAHYAKSISLKLLVIGAYTKDRRDIKVPRLIT
jgi:hypothetical protein